MRSALLLGVFFLLPCCSTCDAPKCAPAPAEPLGPPEVRASWVVGTSLTDAASVRKTVDEAKAMHLNSIMVQVRARGDAIFQSSVEPQAMHLQGKGVDLLAEALRDAGGDLEVHAWVNACLVANADALPEDPRHVTVAHPEWLSVPQELSGSFTQSPRSQYRAALARYAIEHKNEVEGLFCDPAVPEYRAHVVLVVRDLLARYRLAGIHLDYIRYPSPKWGCSKAALELFRAEVDRDLSPKDRADMKLRVGLNTLAYAERYPVRFAEFRRSAVTHLVEEVAQVCRERRVLLTAAVFPDIADAREKRFQDWASWLDRGLLDAACPMIYTTDAAKYEEQVRAAVGARGRGRIWAGMGAWKLDAKEIARRVEVDRKAGASGVVLFSHHALREIVGVQAGLLAGPFALRARRLPEM